MVRLPEVHEVRVMVCEGCGEGCECVSGMSAAVAVGQFVSV